jgi:hypothetical protein
MRHQTHSRQHLPAGIMYMMVEFKHWQNVAWAANHAGVPYAMRGRQNLEILARDG